MPPNLSFESAASIPLGVASAALGLYLDRADSGSTKLTAPWEGGKGQYSGQPIVVFGGSTSVGQYSELDFRVPIFLESRSFTNLLSYSTRKVIWILADRYYGLVAQRSAGESTWGYTSVIDRNAEVQRIVSILVNIVFDTVSEKTTQEQGGKSSRPEGRWWSSLIL